jgi:tetratricopeptide (TPR) repeat protein
MCDPGEHLTKDYGGITGKLEDSIEFLHKALNGYDFAALCDGRCTEECLVIASVYHQMGLVYPLEGSFDKAMDYLNKARAICERVNGHMDLSVAVTVDGGGQVCRKEGDFQAALHFFEEALCIKQMCVHITGKAVITNLTQIASTHQARNDLEAAIFVTRQACTLKRTNYALISAMYLRKHRLLERCWH